MEHENNAVVLILEGVSPALVGSYGSNLARTPAFDRLAVDGVLLDQCFVDSLELNQQLTSLWTGRHALAHSPETPSPELALWTASAARGLEHCLVTDCPQVAQLAERSGCQDVVLVDPPLSTCPVASPFDASAMALFAAAADVLAERQGLVWIHSRGLKLPWDVSLAERAQFVDPEDPEPPSEVGPPQLDVTAETDPDVIVGWGQVATAQAALLDQGLAVLTSVISARPDVHTWSWLVSSLGGVPLGEHGRIGWGSPRLFGEELQTVTVIRESQALKANRAPGWGSEVGTRRPEIFQLPDLAMTVWSLLGLPPPMAAAANAEEQGACPWGRDILSAELAEAAIAGPKDWLREFQLAVVRDARLGQRWIRCPAWSAVLGEDVTRLFVKPEDRWEVNDVADRRPDLCELLDELEQIFVGAVQTNRRGSWDALPEALTDLMR